MVPIYVSLSVGAVHQGCYQIFIDSTMENSPVFLMVRMLSHTTLLYTDFPLLVTT